MPEEATTPDLEEAARRFVEALSRRDFDAALALYTPDAVWDVSLFGLEGVFEGRDTIRGLLEATVAPYEDMDAVLEEFHDFGNGVTFSVVFRRGRLRGSHGALARRDGHVMTLRDGLVERQMVYPDIDEAREAAERLAASREQAMYLVKRCLIAWNTRDLEAVVATFHPDCEMLLPRNRLEGGSYRGHEGVRRAFADTFDAWEDFQIDIEAIRVIDDRALALCRSTAIGKGDAPRVDYESAYLFKMRDGRLASFRPYESHGEALKALRLAE